LTHPGLTVVIPTRNRPQSVVRLLNSISGQTLPPDEFEVVVVDDGSEPPLDLTLAGELPFPVRLLRRTAEPGAHESRFAGLRVATGIRVLFLDDDVVLHPEVLAEHANIEEAFAVGPIVYHPDANTTAYQRYQTKRYGDYALAVIAEGRIPASQIYICNASGPTHLFADVFAGVQSLVRGISVPGDGLDEELLNHQLRDNHGLAQVLPKAVIQHVDTKTLEQARQEKRVRGSIQCRLLLEIPEVRPGFGVFAASYRKQKVKLFWKWPWMFRSIANVLTWMTDRVPARWVPTWILYLPMSIAFWDGFYSVAPRYEQLQAVLVDSSRPEPCEQ
jgi:glycosyltransferase involved in cell wall biosynthesis